MSWTKKQKPKHRSERKPFEWRKEWLWLVNNWRYFQKPKMQKKIRELIDRSK